MCAQAFLFSALNVINAVFCKKVGQMVFIFEIRTDYNVIKINDSMDLFDGVMRLLHCCEDLNFIIHFL